MGWLQGYQLEVFPLVLFVTQVPIIALGAIDYVLGGKTA
jgi:hypothetical protein